MYFLIVVALATLPLLVGAVPVSLKSSRANRPFSIPLSKHSNHLDNRGFVDVEKMHAHLHYTAPFVSLYEKVVSLTDFNLGNLTEHSLHTKETRVNPTPLH